MLIEPEFDPFQKGKIYEEVGVNPYAGEEEIGAKLQEMAENLETLSDAEKAEQMGMFQDAMKKLKSPRNRVLLNSLIVDRINTQHVVEQLQKLPQNLKLDSLKMPPLDVSSILVEGENVEMAKVDFHEVSEDPSLELDLKAINELLKQQPEPRHVSFDS